MISKTITKTYDNFYTKREEQIDITYTLVNGFKTIDEAKEEISKSYDPEIFYYIKVDSEIYAVSMELLGNQLVISNSICYYRNGTYNTFGFRGIEDYCDISELPDIPTIIKTPRVNQWWNDEIEKDITELFDIQVIKGSKIDEKKLPEHQCIILLARILFDTMIPVFELNVIDLYMNDSPSRWKLWRNGVKAYNPYRNKKEMGNRKKLKEQQQQYMRGNS